MAERFTSDLFFIVIVLLVAAILGYLIGYFYRRNKCNKQLKAKDLEIDNLRINLDKVKNELTRVKVDLENCRKELAKVSTPFDAAAAKAVFNMKIVENTIKKYLK